MRPDALLLQDNLEAADEVMGTMPASCLPGAASATVPTAGALAKAGGSHGREPVEMSRRRPESAAADD